MALPEYYNGIGWIPAVGTVTSVGIAGSAGLSVTGSPIISSGIINLTLGSELQALSAFASTGLISRTGSNTYSGRTLTQGTGINITNGNGVMGNPTISLGTVPIANLNGYPATTNSFLRGDGTWTSPLLNNLSINDDVLLGVYNLYTSGNLGAIGVLYSNSFSSYNTGNISVSSPMNFNSNRITNLPDPINTQDPLTLNYFNNNNNLKATQTLTSPSVSFNWPLGTGVYTTYFNHYLLDTSPLTGSSPSFFKTIQSGTGSTKRSWQMQFSPGTSNLPTPSFSLWYQHNSFTGSYANGFSPFSLDYNNSSSTPSFVANFSGSLITALSITTLSGGIITAKINSYNSNNTIDMSSNTLINILNGVNANDAVNVSQLTSNITNTVFLGTGAITLVKGTTAQRPTGVSGMMRWNSTLSQYEGHTGSAWVSFFTATATAYSELQGLSGVNSNGLIARTASGTYTSRTLTTTTGANSLSITNGSGVSGNPQISLSSTAGWY